MKSPPQIVASRLNSDLPTPPNEPLPQEHQTRNELEEAEEFTKEANEKLTEEITDRILAQILQEELHQKHLK